MAFERPQDNPLEELRKAIIAYDTQLAVQSVNQIIDRNLDLNRALDVLTNALRSIGEGFAKDELFLPELLAAACVMEAVLPLLESNIQKAGGDLKVRGKVILGTVFGDMHSIGKQMVGAMLVAHGFKVFDLGVNVKSTTFIDKTKQIKPDILAMSALLTTTAYEQKKVVMTLDAEGQRENVKVIIGGGAVTQQYADSIGADGYDDTAPGAATLAIRLLEEKV